jgi:hypothetical protein
VCRGGRCTLRAAARRARLPTWRAGQAPAHPEPKTPAWKDPAWRATRAQLLAREAARTSRAEEVMIHYGQQAPGLDCQLGGQGRLLHIRSPRLPLGELQLGERQGSCSEPTRLRARHVQGGLLYTTGRGQSSQAADLKSRTGSNASGSWTSAWGAPPWEVTGR